jgi:CRISPR system Cascade subunit CasA
MTDFADNLLTQPLIHKTPGGGCSLPGVLAALSRDAIESYPALRPHQAPTWHMFLVQLAALALHRAEQDALPEDEDEWRRLLRGLRPDFPDDEPWRLVVADWSKPAFLQPPVPVGIKLENVVHSPDALDLLITSKNHDLKKAVARRGAPDDWIFALVSLQTGEGYGGAGNQGIARMNGGSSSRSMIALAPTSSAGAKAFSPQPGAWFRRDVRALAVARKKALVENEQIGFPAKGGIGLVWVEPWPEGDQLRLDKLDIWFIEVCRRVRLLTEDGQIAAVKGTSKATRIDAKNYKGALGDPYAPVHKTKNKSLTLGDGDFDYRRVTDLLFSGDWALPILACPAVFETHSSDLALVCAALSRGNSKTDGFKSRTIPVRNHAPSLLGSRR